MSRFSRIRGLLLLAPALLVAATAVPIRAQQTGTIAGIVTDLQSRMPVSGAQVRALSGTSVAASALTAGDGTYRLTNVPAGTYEVVALRIGFVPQRQEGVSVTGGGTASVNLQMRESVTELNPVVTVASRTEEKALSAPASVSVVDVRKIEEQPSVTVADHLEGLAGVDISRGGIAQSNIVARGFNNAFSGSILTLQDYRFAAVPSLRVNVPLLFTASNEDIERVEVLLGPASALYGPNSSHGVLHVITKSPFESEGTTLTIDGGNRSLLRGSARFATIVTPKVAFKLSGEYLTATDWEYHDPGEPTVFPDAAPPGRRGQPDVRDFALRRYTSEARMDVRPATNAEYVTTVGLSHIGSGLEYTGANGTALAKNWTYVSAQQRMRVGRLFAQVFGNFSDAGNPDSLSLKGTYLLRSGQPIVDQSRVYAAQIQHGLSIGTRQDFIYGLDYIYTNPRTGNTINGRNEGIDNVREIGGYVQSTTNLGAKWDFVAALRVDNNDQIDGEQVSPRAAIVFKPTENHNLRFTYNRAFSTPANFTWFLDLIQARNILGTPYNIRALGNPPKVGWTFRRDCSGSAGDLCMRTIFTGPAGESVWQPASAAVAYQGAILGNASAIIAGLAPKIQAGLGVPSATAQGVAQQLVTFLGQLQPTPSQVGTKLRYLGSSHNLSSDEITDIGPIKAAFNNTYELGYKGIIARNFRLAIDAWSEKRGDVGNPAGLATPNVFFDSASFHNFMQAALIPAITGALQQPPFNMSPAQAQGTAQVFAPQVAAGIAGSAGLGALPLGIVSFNSEQFASARDVYATYTSYNKTIIVKGLDLAADLVASSNWTFSGTYSWVSDLVFPGVTSSNALPLMLNAPDDKATLSAQFRDEPRGWGFEVRGRYINAYPVNSGVFASDFDFPKPGTAGYYRYEGVHTSTLVDASVNKRFRTRRGAMLWSLNAENLLNHGYRTMPGTPLLGRMIVTRLQYQF